MGWEGGGEREEDDCGGAYHGHDVKGHEVQAAPVGGLRGDAFLEGAVSEFVGSTGHRLLSPSAQAQRQVTLSSFLALPVTGEP